VGTKSYNIDYPAAVAEWKTDSTRLTTGSPPTLSEEHLKGSPNETNNQNAARLAQCFCILGKGKKYFVVDLNLQIRLLPPSHFHTLDIYA